MADELTGGCACGAVRYRLLAPPIWTHCCHCTWCQRETGSAFAINALVEFDRVEVTAGQPEPLLTPSASGRGQVITRCPDCRVALWSTYGGGPAILFVRAGTLDQRQSITPDIHIYTASKLPWVQIPPGARSVPEFYDYRETWPAASYERRGAAIARYRAAHPG
jgi:hypothetical protein